MDVKSIRKELIDGNVTLVDLDIYRNELNLLKDSLMSKKNLTKEEFDDETELIMIYLDYYTYSSGDSLISDYEYDQLMRHYISNGGELIVKSDNLKNITQWDFTKHEAPGMVGSVSKIYTFEELVTYFKEHKSRSYKWVVAPKFDGISSAIKINSDGDILLGVTRNNGIEGQNITEMIKKCRNAKMIGDIYKSKLKKGEYVWIKTELVVTSNEYDDLCNEKKYKNRRSATSGIVNSPKNIHLSKYVTIIPLAAYFPANDEVEYKPIDSKIVSAKNAYELMEHIDKMFTKIKDFR